MQFFGPGLPLVVAIDVSLVVATILTTVTHVLFVKVTRRR